MFLAPAVHVGWPSRIRNARPSAQIRATIVSWGYSLATHDLHAAPSSYTLTQKTRHPLPCSCLHNSSNGGARGAPGRGIPPSRQFVHRLRLTGNWRFRPVSAIEYRFRIPIPDVC